jgi:tetratricopeptide (TPR) repeat protein
VDECRRHYPGNRILRIARGTAIAKSPTLVSRGSGWWSAPLSLARFSAPRRAPLAEGLRTRNLHNIFLDAATAQGLPGFLILLATTALAIRVATSSRKDVPVLLAGFVAILVCHQFSVFTVPTALGFWITLAMLVAAEPASETVARDRTMPWLLPVSLALILAAVRMTIGDHHLAAMRTALDASRFDEAQTEYTAAARCGLHADIWYSRKLLLAGRQTQALAPALSATLTAEDSSNAWMNLALIYAELNNAGQTEYCIRNAIAASPNWYKPHLALARLLQATHRSKEAEKEFLDLRR